MRLQDSVNAAEESTELKRTSGSTVKTVFNTTMAPRIKKKLFLKLVILIKFLNSVDSSKRSYDQT